MSALQRQHTAFERCYLHFLLSRVLQILSSTPHKLGPAEPAEYRRRFQSHLAGSPAFLFLLGCPGLRCRRMLSVKGAREAASSSQASVHTVNVLSIIRSGNDLFLQTQSPGSRMLRSNGGPLHSLHARRKAIPSLIPVPTEAAHVH